MNPLTAPKEARTEAWKVDCNEGVSLDSRLESINRKMRNEEFRYAKFIARRRQLSQMVPPSEFKQLVS